MPLSEHQWEIRTEDKALILPFGTLDTGIQTRHAPDLGQRSVRSTDAALPREDGEVFGPDFENGTTITFECDVLTDTHVAQVDLLDRLGSTWRDKRFRATSHDYAILRCLTAGRIRRVYGRPRRFAETDGDQTHQGWTGVVFDFKTFDGTFYDDNEIIEELTLNPTSSGGLQGPLSDPLTIANSGERHGEVTVRGEPTWAVVTFHGPVLNPSVRIGDEVIALDLDLNEGQSVTVDPRPWSRSVTRNDGANLAGALTYETPPMRDMKLDPGTYLLSFTGTDPTGTARCSVAWRNAHSRP